jgi:hypothetical protein
MDHKVRRVRKQYNNINNPKSKYQKVVKEEKTQIV